MNSLGSSPLTRGKRSGQRMPGHERRLIPAHAGKTWRDETTRSISWAHPRSRGENARVQPATLAQEGSSPLTRGKRQVQVHTDAPVGLIPAHAGKTCSSSASHHADQAHPRSRGENHGLTQLQHAALGSSPLTRGKPVLCPDVHLVGGLIPAHAGKTGRGVLRRVSHGAHPRSRGENVVAETKNFSRAGSSPLTRGKHAARVNRRVEHGLIPAHAGKTWSPGWRELMATAHPRSRGENGNKTATAKQPHGSSPLTRGKRGVNGGSESLVGLIPAHAGKTLPDLRFYCADRSDLGNP